MASIRKRGRGYQVRYWDPAGRQRSRTFHRKVDAERFAHSVETDKDRGEWVDPQLGKISFGEWSRQYQATRVHLRDSTRARDESVLRSLILPYFQNRPLGRVQPVHVQQWLAQLVRAGKATATVREAARIFSATMEAAVRNRMIVRNPAAGISLPRLERPEMRILTPDKIAGIADQIEPRYRALVLVGGYTGLRIGEATHLRPDHLNLLRRQLRVVEHLKTEASRRTVSLPRFLVEELAQHLGKYRGEYVFIAPEGGQVRPQNFRRRAWRPVAPEGVRFHDLRHSHAAMLIAAGVHPKVIQERLGHTSIKTTLDIYGHLYDGLDEAAADTLDDVFERSRVDKMWPSSTGQLAQS